MVNLVCHVASLAPDYLQPLRQMFLKHLIICFLKHQRQMSQSPKLIGFHDTQCRLMTIENCGVPILKLAILHQFSERLRESLKVNQKLLVSFQNVEILFCADHLIQEERVLLVCDVYVEGG